MIGGGVGPFQLEKHIPPNVSIENMKLGVQIWNHSNPTA